MRGSLKEAIPMTEAQFGLLTTVFLLVYAVLSPYTGFLADRFNRSHVIVASLLVWSFVTWLTAHARTYEQLFATRLLMGISEASYMPAALALVADYHRGATRSLATGILLGGVIVGSGLGGLGGWLAERQGWSYAFSLFGLIGIAYSFVLAFSLRDVPREKVNESTPTESVQSVQLGQAIRTLFGSLSFILMFIYWGLLGLAGWMVVGWMPTYFQEQFHLTQGAAGLLATIYLNIATLVGFVAGGAWVDRWSLTNSRACIFVSVIGLCAAVPGILLVSNTNWLAVALAGLVLFGFTSSFAQTEIMPILCQISDPRYRATGFGVLNFFACVVGGATIYAGGALRDAQVDVSKLFQCGAVGVAICAGLLLFVKPSSPSCRTLIQ
jgi:predicted MFS family arabinose efflux permease